MKTKYIISILFLSLGLVVIGQTTTIYTPYGTEVSVTEPEDMSSWARNNRDYYYRVTLNHPDAIFHVVWPDPPTYLYLSSTLKFNCHGYAWHMYWLGADLEDQLDEPYEMSYTEAANYFTDPSFKECTQSEADIWWINNGTHSAVATGDPEFLKSKWGDGPLATHEIDDQPYTVDYPTTSFYRKCYREVHRIFDSDITLEHCKVMFYESSVYSNVDLEIEYEDWLLIERDFVTGTGSTLYLHPE
jgi:hypothetical protein